MPPKKAAGTAAPKKSASAAPAHASYKDMIKNAILNLKERNGSSRQAIKKYIKANNNLGATTDAQFSSQINRALAAGEANGEFARPKGASGPVKLAKKDAAKTKDSSKAKTGAKKSAAKAAPKKEKTTAAATTTKKSTTKAATKKAAPKDKANAGRPRKTAAAKSAPAVDEKPAVVMGKTKSGRVTKTKAPIAAAKKAAPKKAAAAKKAAPKKSSTPKKAEASAAAA